MNADRTDSRIETILVGIDGSPESALAASFAASLARQLGSQVVAAHAVGLLEVWPEHPENHDERNTHVRVDGLVSGLWTDPLRVGGVEPRIVVRDGPPSIALLAIAEEVDADLIVIGSRGVGNADVYALGSTSAKIAQSATRPVVIVPGVRT